jgi:XTP/dITP diphosphohydrolase
MELILATYNLHKIRELKELLRSCFKDLDILSISQFPNYRPPEEVGASFTENAFLKAKDAAFNLKKWTLADDSGLVVPMLQGQPGIISHRFAGPKSTDLDNRKKLLKEMEHLSDDYRQAFFECALALCSPEGFEKCVTGFCHGYITHEEKGANGFGYDALFVKHDYDKTFAELDHSVKNRISHRYKAFEKLKPYFNFS